MQDRKTWGLVALPTDIYWASYIDMVSTMMEHKMYEFMRSSVRRVHNIMVIFYCHDLRTSIMNSMCSAGIYRRSKVFDFVGFDDGDIKGSKQKIILKLRPEFIAMMKRMYRDDIPEWLKEPYNNKLGWDIEHNTDNFIMVMQHLGNEHFTGITEKNIQRLSKRMVSLFVKAKGEIDNAKRVRAAENEKI